MRKSAMSNKDSEFSVRGEPPGPAGKGGGQRRCAKRTARQHTVSRCSIVTNVSASIWSAGPPVLVALARGDILARVPVPVHSQLKASSTDRAFRGNEPRLGISLPHFCALGSAMSATDREADENSLFTGEMPSGVIKEGKHNGCT